MTQQAEILRGSIPAKKGQSTAHWRIIGLGAGFAALVLVALVILLTPAVPPAVQPQGAGSEFAMNPELMVARRSAELMVGRADTTNSLVFGCGTGSTIAAFLGQPRRNALAAGTNRTAKSTLAPRFMPVPP
jgi:hypothetical protein